MALFPKVVGVLEKSMQAANLRHQVLANNIANVNVPGYQALEVSFEENLKAALMTQQEESGLRGLATDARHIPINGSAVRPISLEPQVRLAETGVMRQDGNTVDVESEMARLAANQLWYQSVIRSVSDEFNRLRTAMNEGRR